MNQAQTYSWIFYAVASASQQVPADYAGIESVADGINHAVPTQQEMRASLSWLATQNLVQKDGKRYRLSNPITRLDILAICRCLFRVQGNICSGCFKCWK